MNAIAERIRDTQESALPDPAPYLAKALDEAIDRLFDNERIPRRGAIWTDLQSQLDGEPECAAWLTSILCASHANQDEVIDRVRDECEEWLRRKLEGSQTIRDMAADLAVDARFEEDE